MKTLVPALIALSVIFTSSIPTLRGSPLSAADRDKILAEVKPLMQAVDEACQRLDAGAATRDFLNSPETLAVSSEGDMVDPDTLRESLKDLYSRLSSLKFTPIRDEYRILAPDLVLRVWSYRVDGVSTKKGPWFIDPETATFLLRKLDGAWKCIFFQESSRPLKRVAPSQTGT